MIRAVKTFLARLRATYTPPEASSGALNRAILDSAADGIYGLDKDGVTTFANPAAAGILGWSAEEMIGRCQHRLIHHTKPDGTPHPIDECPIYAASRDGLIHHEEEDVFWRKDGSNFPVSYTATPLREAGATVGSVVVFRDITDRKKKELAERDRQQELETLVRGKTWELSLANAKFTSILEAAELVAVIATDLDRKIILFNKGAERMLGYLASEVVGVAMLTAFLVPDEVEARRRELNIQYGFEIAASEVFALPARYGAAEARDWTFVRKDGSRFPITLAVTEMKDDTGKPVGFLGVAFDITKQKTAEETLKTAKVAAEAANRAKSEFLATMSHEIRTPMNGVLGMADLLFNSDLDPRQRKRAKTLRDSAEALLNVLNDILDFSKIEAKKLELEVADFDLRTLVEGVADLMAVKAQEKGLEVTCFIDPEVPTRLCGDPSRLRQVLANLVGNAVKFTNKGEVCIHVRPGGSEQAGAVRVEVTDSGIGVPAEKHHLLFERFSQADASTARQYGGSGLGLSIVHGLVEMMGGKTGFESSHGKGSTFWFTAALPIQPAFKRPRPLSLNGKRILVVDDNSASRHVLRQMLTFWNCEAEEFSDAAGALARMKDETKSLFDAVIIDLEMPDFRGDRLGDIMRLDARLESTPIVLLTPLKQTGLPRIRESAWFVGRVTKPVKQGELGASLASALGYRPFTGAPASTLSVAAPQKDRTQHRLLVVEDNIVNQEVIMGMLEHLGYRADVVSDAPSALRLVGETAYALVLTDCQLPEMDGYELSRLIRRGAALNPQVPIIAVTAHSLAGDREKCLAAGMDDYLSKPIRPEALDALLTQWIEGTTKTTVSLPPEPALDCNFDKEDFVERLMGNEKLARRVAATFITSMPQQLTALATAIKSFDGPATRLAAHSIKGAAANVGGSAIRELAAKLEKMGESGEMESAAEVLPALDASFQALRPVIQRFCDDQG
jgi:PAS domain S-box-containing protein